MVIRHLSVLGILAIFGSLVPSGRADEPSVFVDTVEPVLVARCVSCHGPEKQEGGLRLDSRAAVLRGGDNGPSLKPGDPDASLLIKAVRFADPDLQMPPKDKLPAKQIDLLEKWVRDGAPWPDPPVVLFEDEPQFVKSLNQGAGKARLITDAPFAGKAALAVTPPQRFSDRIPGWSFLIREKPQAGEHRFLRLAWKKRGAGGLMIEVAMNGQWPDAKSPKGRYLAGPNTTGWATVTVAEVAPAEWTVVTFDLWKDLGDVTLTGFAPTCDGGEEAYFDSILLAPSVASLDAYRPGDSSAVVAPNELAGGSSGSRPVGDAFTDAANPIRRLFQGERLDLWSLRRPQPAPGLDTVAPKGDRTVGAVRIDTLVDRQLAEQGLRRSPEADRRTLIRRLTFDLLGVPPTPEEVDAFVGDKSPDAYPRLVRRLLESPRYGERQARLWLDVVRYADTNGYERDEFRPLAWQYRDYVIRSFNQDKPFDQFVREQLAGDELLDGPPRSAADADKLIATGFLRLGQWDSTASIFQEEERLRAEQMADLTNTTAAAFLGLTMSCCQCHDHKYDPLSQADHYRLRAFFAGLKPRDDLNIELADEQQRTARHNAELDQQIEQLKAEQAKLDKKVEADKARHEQLEQQRGELAAKRRQPRVAMGASDGGANAPSTHVFYQGDFHSPRDAVDPGFVSVLRPGPAPIEAPRADTSGRRLALANWIASPENPWTARVLVNRVWQQHFGVGIVATPNDLGYSGARPINPELLDQLAVDFMRDGWSIKHLHRDIALSATYRQASVTANPPSPSASTAASTNAPTIAPEIAATKTVAKSPPDPENRLLWRQNVRRLDAETLRDSLLFVSGLLKPYDGGKPLWPPVPDDLLKAQPAILEAEKGGDGGRMQGWYADPIEQTDVRSVYLVRKRCLPIPFLQAFDLPDTTVSCARRDTTVVAPQALMLLNSPSAVRYCEALADRIAELHPTLNFDDDAAITAIVQTVFRQTLCRSADEDERRLAVEFLRRHRERHAEAGAPARDRDAQANARRSLVDLCRAALNLNEFVYVD